MKYKTIRIVLNASFEVNDHIPDGYKLFSTFDYGGGLGLIVVKEDEPILQIEEHKSNFFKRLLGK